MSAILKVGDMTPGASWLYPIWHDKWRIYESQDFGAGFAFVHDAYDGANEGDNRRGHARTVEQAKSEIDERWPCRQRTNDCAPDNGDCLRCFAANGEVCRDKAKAEGK